MWCIEKKISACKIWTKMTQLIFPYMRARGMGVREPYGNWLKYLFLNHLTHSELEEIAFQPWKMKQALLISAILCKPRPPSSLLGRWAFFQLRVFKFDQEDRKFLKVLLMALHFLGRGRTVEMWIGILEITCLIGWASLQKERSFDLHPKRLWLIAAGRDTWSSAVLTVIE